jgi:ferric-dicitrate binding protein FerR (iron transport regulator)
MEFFRESEIAYILSKLPAGELSTDELAKLELWAAESETNRELYESVASGAMFAEQVALTGHFDRVRGRRRITAKLRRRVWLRAAAVAIPAAAVVTGVLIVGRLGWRGVADDASGLEMLPAGKAKAVLSYHGTRIALGMESQGSEWERYVEQAVDDAGPADGERVKIEIPRGGEYELHLGDGTRVWLNSESSIEYPLEFQGDRRSVRLTGEAYFEVAPDAVKRFEVDFGDAQVRVLGTSFNISAYEGDGAATATLVSGRVEVLRQGVTAELRPGTRAVMKSGSAGITVDEVDVSLYTAWTKGVFEFENMRLEDMCRRLSRWYDVSFEFTGDTGDEKFTGGTWKYLPLGEFLEGIEKVTDVRFSYSGDKVVVSK